MIIMDPIYSKFGLYISYIMLHSFFVTFAWFSISKLDQLPRLSMGSDLRLLFGVDAETFSVNPKTLTWREHASDRN